MSIRWLLGGLVFVALRAYAGGVDTSVYRPSTLAETHAGVCARSRVEHVFDARFLKISAVVTDRSETRSIKASVKKFVQMWAKAFRQPSKIPLLFSQEIRVREGGRDYWLPIQTQLLDPLRSEVPRGYPFTVFVVYGGCEGGEPVFLVTEFKTATQ